MIYGRKNIGEKVLYVKGKVPTTYVVLGLGYGGQVQGQKLRS
jgi:hypothetical protein